jgi:molybdopterin-guanine dinucleotide biosynthesis protein A
MAFLSKESRELVAIKKVDIPPIAVDFYLRLSQALKRMAASAPADSVFAVLIC